MAAILDFSSRPRSSQPTGDLGTRVFGNVRPQTIQDNANGNVRPQGFFFAVRCEKKYIYYFYLSSNNIVVL